MSPVSRSKPVAAAGPGVAATEPAFEPLQCVEVFGLTSEEGRRLNGKIGVVVRYLPESRRYEVHTSPQEVANLRGANIRTLDPKAIAAQSIAALVGPAPQPQADATAAAQGSDAEARCTAGEGAETAGEGADTETSLPMPGQRRAKAGGSRGAATEAAAARAEPEPGKRAPGQQGTPRAGAGAPEAAKGKRRATVAEQLGTPAQGGAPEGKRRAAGAEQTGPSRAGAAQGGAPEGKRRATGAEQPSARGGAPEVVEGKRPVAASTASPRPATPKPQRKRGGQGDAKRARPAAKASDEGEVSTHEGMNSKASKDRATTTVASTASPRPATPKPQRNRGEQGDAVGSVPKRASPASHGGEVGEVKPHEGTASKASKGRAKTAAASTASPRPATPKPQRKRCEQSDTVGSVPKRARPAAKASDEGEVKPHEGTDSKASTKIASGKGTCGQGIDLSTDVLEEAAKLGLVGALRNLAGRDAVRERGFAPVALLSALKVADGLVNKAKAALLGDS